MQSTILNPIRVEEPQRSPGWFRARLGSLTGSVTKDAFLEISDTAKGAAIREILQVKALSAKLKETPEFLELWEKPGLELFEMANMEPPESKAREDLRQRLVGERLTGLEENPEGGFVTYDMKWGTVNENFAIAKYRLMTGNIVKEAPFMRHPELRCGASPDGEVVDVKTGEMGVLEVKCLKTKNHLYKVIKQKTVPDDYIVQIHMEMWITGAGYCDFIAFDPRLPGKLEIFVMRVMRDENYLTNILIPQVTNFLKGVDEDEKYFRRLARMSKSQERLLYNV
jgi:hypothetical protein